jgi:hypothetical protein
MLFTQQLAKNSFSVAFVENELEPNPKMDRYIA